jgi:hypothetical protein
MRYVTSTNRLLAWCLAVPGLRLRIPRRAELRAGAFIVAAVRVQSI